MNSAEPASIDPTGALSPFDRQNITESTGMVRSRTSALSPIAALKMRAPSRCTGNPASWATAQSACVCAGLRQVPPLRL